MWVIVKDAAETYEFYKRLGFKTLNEPFQTPSRTPDNPRTSCIARVEGQELHWSSSSRWKEVG